VLYGTVMSFAAVTRDAVRAAPFFEALAPLGLSGVAMPVTSAVGPEDPSAVEAALGSLRPGDVVALASARASAVVAAIATRLELPLHGVSWWAVGEATAAPLRKLGYLVTTAPRSSSAGLAEALLTCGVAGRRVLLPRAEEGRDEAALALRDGGAHVDEVIAYRTVAVAADAPELSEGVARWLAGQIEVAVVLAPSQVAALRAVLAVNGLAMSASPVLFAAIGETTGQALLDSGVERWVVASASTPQAMANAVASRYPGRR
jgi:uroporphyrinogen-III synthase